MSKTSPMSEDWIYSLPFCARGALPAAVMVMYPPIMIIHSARMAAAAKDQTYIWLTHLPSAAESGVAPVVQPLTAGAAKATIGSIIAIRVMIANFLAIFLFLV